jgi:SprT protein
MTTPPTVFVTLNWQNPKVNDNHYLAKAQEQTRRLLRKAASQFAVSLPDPEIRFDLRGKAAGMALFQGKHHAVIRYNRGMLIDHGDAFIERTVPHEVAHLVARHLHGASIRPHGKEWREIMGFFGADSKRCHNFPVREEDRRRMRYFDYRCSCQDHSLSAIRHHRHLAGVAYLCRRCGSALRPVSNEDG